MFMLKEKYLMSPYLFYLWQRRARTAAHMVALCAIFVLSSPGCSQGESSEGNLEKIDALYQQSKSAFPDAPDISADELIKRMKTEEMILVDNRAKAERDVSMIPGAVSESDFESNIESYAESMVVVYCTIGDRSGHYTQKLREKNIDAINLRGGVLAWAHAGGTFTDSQGNETDRVHVYGRKWNLLPEGYEAVW